MATPIICVLVCDVYADGFLGCAQNCKSYIHFPGTNCEPNQSYVYWTVHHLDS